MIYLLSTSLHVCVDPYFPNKLQVMSACICKRSQVQENGQFSIPCAWVCFVLVHTWSFLAFTLAFVFAFKYHVWIRSYCYIWRSIKHIFTVAIIYRRFPFFLFLQALLELWNAGGLKQFDDARILVLAENAKLWVFADEFYVGCIAPVTHHFCLLQLPSVWNVVREKTPVLQGSVLLLQGFTQRGRRWRNDLSINSPFRSPVISFCACYENLDRLAVG